MDRQPHLAVRHEPRRAATLLPRLLHHPDAHPLDPQRRRRPTDRRQRVPVRQERAVRFSDVHQGDARADRGGGLPA